MSVTLVEATEATSVKMLRINGASTLEARLPQALFQTLAQASSGDLRVKFSAQSGVPVSLKSRVRATSISEQVRRRTIVWIFGTSCYGWI